MKATINIFTIALLSVIMMCLLAVPAMAQEEIIWQHSAVIPWDAERLTNNNALITEYGNHTIIEVNTTTNEIVWQYGTGIAGSGPDQLNSPVDAERLLSGNTLITDRNNHRVIEVNTTGAIVWQYGTTGTSGSGYDELNNPMDAERLSDGNTLIADRFNDRVIEVNESKGIVWQYGITNPFDADRLSNGNTLIAEYTNHRVIEINTSDEIVWQYGTGTAGSGVNQLNYPMDADRLLDGNTLIADYINDRVIEVRTSDYDPAETDNGFTAASIVWEYGSNHPADADRLSSGSTLISEAGNNSVIEVVFASFEIDLLPTALGIPTLYDDMTNTIGATILNNGTGYASSFNVSLSVGGSTVDEVEVSGLGAGESTVVNLCWTPSEIGDVELCVTADSDLEVDESDEGNNLLCENATVLSSEHPCWNDTFDDETKIAEKHYTIVENGDVEIDLSNLSVSEWWYSDPSQVAGLGAIGSRSAPEMAFNITGDGRWNLIAGHHGGFCGWYWNGSQWISDSSLVAGLVAGTCADPSIAFNITGDGRWNLIAGEYNGVFKGFYWNGSQWISDSSLVAGLGDIGSYSSPTAAFSITGDGRWNLLSGDELAGFNGWYWNGSQWISDSSLVAGLGSLGYWACSTPTMAFNITEDGKWNLIAGNYYGEFFGYYWNGTQWINSPSLVSGLVGSYRSQPSVAFKDGKWCMVAGTWGGTFDGFVYGARTSITSEVISLPAGDHWQVFFANDTLPDHTHITYKILDEWNNTLMNVVPGQAITDITDAKVRLSAELITDSFSKTPVLHDWGICYEEGLPVGVLKEKKRLTFDPNSSRSPSVATDSEGNVHVVWAEDRSGWQIHFMKLAADGTVMINEKVLPASGVDPTILIDPDDNLHVTFDGSYTGYLPDASYMKLDNDGEVLIAPKKILSGYGYPTERFPWRRAFTIDSTGDIHAVEMYVISYQCGNGECRDDIIRYIKFDNEGRELLNTTLVSFCIKVPKGPVEKPCDAVSIATDSDGSAHIVYNRGVGGYMAELFDIYYFKVDSSGAVLKDTRLTTDLNESRYPVVSTDATGNAHIVWCDNRAGWDLNYMKLDSSGDILIDNKQITFESSADSFGVSSIDIESGVIHVTFSQKSKIYYMALDTNGIGIVDRVLLSPPGHETSASNPGMDAISGGSHLVWNEKREHDPASEIYYARLVLPNRVLILAPPGQWTPQNIVATYTIGILSTMTTTETFSLTLDNPDRADVAELSTSVITIDPNSIGEVTLNVTDKRVGDYLMTVTATSQTNPEIRDSAAITTSVVVPTSDLIITAMDAYHNGTGYSPLFNLSNEVDVTMKNIGTKDAGAFDVELYADTTLIDTQSVSGLGYGSSTIVQFKWTPIGADCEDGGSPQTYTLKAVADCSDVISESDETNNEATAEETAYWAGYSADEHINAVAWHGVLRGGLDYTTGDGDYTGLYSPGSSVDTHYSITLPAGASVELARLNVYYTWSKDYTTGAYPAMEVSITNTSGTSVVPINASYDDRPCDSPAIGFNYPFGNYVYDLTPYITGDDSYTVTVKNVGTTGHSFCIAAPGVVILYKDSSKPEREFWILEGADLLEGGRRGGAGNLALSECISNATFAGSIDTGRVETATLGIVSAWGGEAWGTDLNSYYWFNDNYLGDGSILGGYSSVYDETVDGMSMYVGASGNAQVGANVSDVTGYITGQDNTASFGDDGDSMMAANAFLVVEYDEPCRGEEPEPAFLVPFMISGSVTNYSDGTKINNPDVTIENVNTGESLIVETHNGSNYYQVLTSLEKVSCGDVLQFTCDGTRLKHTVGQREVDAGGFVLDIAVGMMPEAIEAGVTLSPKKIDLNSSGVLKAYITLPGYDVANISVSTVECEGADVFGFGKVIPGKQALEVKFNIQNLTVPTGPEVLLTVTGELNDGTPFEGSNTVEVV